MQPIIELDCPRPSRADQPPPRGPRRTGPARRAVAALEAVVLLLVVAGALMGPPELPRRLSLIWTGHTSAGMLWVDGGSVFALWRLEDQVVLTAYEVDTGRITWQRPLTGALARRYVAAEATVVPWLGQQQPPRASVVASAAGVSDLIGYPTTALPLVYFAGSVALLIDRAPGAEPEEPDTQPTGPANANSPDLASEASWAAEHRVTAVDLATGQTRWARGIPAGSTWALPGVHPWIDGFAGYPSAEPDPWLVVADAAGQAQIWDLATGRTRAELSIDPLARVSYVAALPATVVTYDRGSPTGTMSWYGPESPPRTLAVAALPDAYGSLAPFACGKPLCLVGTSTVRALDQSTGGLVWEHFVGPIHAVTPQAIATSTNQGGLLIDTATGTDWLLPDGWRLATRRGDGPIVAVRQTGPRVSLGLLDDIGRTVESLGAAGDFDVPSACQATATHVVCAGSNWVRAWRIVKFAG